MAILADFRRHWSFERSLRIDPQSKPEVYRRILDAADFLSVNYWLELLFAAGIATLGLVLNSPGVVIGAMLISPLMGPILAAGLALAAGDLFLGFRSFINLLLSVVVSVTFAATMVWLLPFQTATTEILNRTSPNLLDLGVAVFSGLAGSLVLARGGGGGGVTALPGVAIAVALMPPLCTVGFGVGSGFQWPIVSGALLLFLTNLAAIIASAFVVFLIVDMDSPEVRERIDASIRVSGKEDLLFQLLERTPLARSLAHVGQLRWRVAMIVAVLAMLAIPLRQSLLQLRDETIARTAVRDTVQSLAPRGSVLSQALDISSDRVRAQLVVTQAVKPEAVETARRALIQKIGKDVEIVVHQVAGEHEIEAIRGSLQRPLPPTPPTPAFAELAAEIRRQADPALREAWPEALATLTAVEVRVRETAPVILARYEAKKPLDAGAIEVLRRVVARRLKIEAVEVEGAWSRPSPKATQSMPKSPPP